MKRSAVALLAVLVALAVSVPLAIYGSLRPCEILRAGSADGVSHGGRPDGRPALV